MYRAVDTAKEKGWGTSGILIIKDRVRYMQVDIKPHGPQNSFEARYGALLFAQKLVKLLNEGTV